MIVIPKKKWASVKQIMIHLGKTEKIKKSMRGPFWDSLRLGYKYSIKKNNLYIAMYYSLLNSLYTLQRVVGTISKKSLIEMIKNDENLKNKISLNSGNNEKNSIYSGFLLFITANNLIKIHNPNKSQKEVYVIELIDNDFLPFFNQIDPQKQLEEAFNFLQKKNKAIEILNVNNSREIKKQFLETRNKKLEIRNKKLVSSSKKYENFNNNKEGEEERKIIDFNIKKEEKGWKEEGDFDLSSLIVDYGENDDAAPPHEQLSAPNNQRTQENNNFNSSVDVDNEEKIVDKITDILTKQTIFDWDNNVMYINPLFFNSLSDDLKRWVLECNYKVPTKEQVKDLISRGVINSNNAEEVVNNDIHLIQSCLKANNNTDNITGKRIEIVKKFHKEHVHGYKNIDFLLKIMPDVEIETLSVNNQYFFLGRIDAFADEIYTTPKNGGRPIQSKIKTLLDFIPQIGPIIPLKLFFQVVKAAFKEYNHDSYRKIEKMYCDVLLKTYENFLIKYQSKEGLSAN